MKLVILGELVDLNTYINAERANRFKAAKIKKDETEKIYWECKKQKLKQVKSPTEAFFTWYHRNMRKDLDNIEFSQKFIWDGLVLAKILIDDSQKYTPSVRHHKHLIDKENPRVEVEII